MVVILSSVLRDVVIFAHAQKLSVNPTETMLDVDINGNKMLIKKRADQKIDAVAAIMDAYIAYNLNRDAFG